MASISASDCRLHGGSLEILELDAVLQRDACDWLLPCLLMAFFLGVRGASSSCSGEVDLFQKQLMPFMMANETVWAVGGYQTRLLSYVSMNNSAAF